MKTIYLFSTILLVGLLTNCGSDDGDPGPKETPLVASIANAEQTVAPFTEVTLDGSASTGPDGFSYEWIYSGNETISLSSTSEAVVTFTPEKNTTYSFILQINFIDKSGQTVSNQAFATIVVTGVIVLDASSFVTDQLILTDIDSDPSTPDYIINENFVIPTGKSVSIADNSNVTIGVDDGVGIIVNGTLTGGTDSQGTRTLSIIANNTSWNGLLIDGGEFSTTNTVTIDKAGGAAFSGQDEAAVITVINDGTLSIGGSLLPTNTLSDLGINFTSTASLSQELNGFITNVKIPIKAPIGLLSAINAMVFDGYDYVQLVTSGASITEGLSSGDFEFTNGRYYYIDGDFTAGSPIIISNTATVYMKEGAGIVSSAQFTLASSTIEGLDGASWKGIASTGHANVQSSTISNAGQGLHDTGSFSTTDMASIFVGSSFDISHNTFSTNNGSGIVIPSTNTSSGGMTGNTFTNTSLYDIQMPFSRAAVGTNNTWSGDTPVALKGGSISSSVQIADLGGEASYVISSDVTFISGTLTIDAGTSLKFKSNTGLSFTSTGLFSAEGTAEDPIIFDSEEGTIGSWDGLALLLGTYQMDYCTITNGGQNAYIGYSAANVVFATGSSELTYPQVNYKFDNNTVSNSVGSGSTVGLSKYNPLIDNTTNTFTDNISQDSDGDAIPDDSEFMGCNNDPGC